MGTVTGLTKTRMLAIEAASVISGIVDGAYHLILTKKDGTTIDAGYIRGAQGPQGIPGSITSSPAGGSLTGTYPNPGLGTNVVVAGTIQGSAVTTTKINDAAVTNPKIADGAVDSAKIADGSIVHGDIAAANKDGVAATPSLRTLGTGAQQAAAGNHEHAQALTDRSASAVQAIPNAAQTTVLLPDGTLDGWTYSAGVFTCTKPGAYVISSVLSYATNTTGRRIQTLWVNGTEVQRNEQTTSVGGIFSLSMSYIHRFVAGDTLELKAYQSSGAALNTSVTNPSTQLQALRTGP